MLCLGGAVVKAWSRTQPNIALSVGEAELVAISKAGTDAIGLRSLLTDIGLYDVAIDLFTDSATAQSIASRKGVGRVRLLDTQLLWPQEVVRMGVSWYSSPWQCDTSLFNTAI